MRTRVLLIEDNPGDADLVREFLSAEGGEFQVLHAERLSEAIETLRSVEIDVVVLDLRLPDSTGIDSLRAIRSRTDGIPIVVLTGSDDEKLALACVDAGAQDYLDKSEIRPHALRRVIGYAISRVRESQLRELQQTLDQYRMLGTQAAATSVTAQLAGVGPLSVRAPGPFARMVQAYQDLLEPYLGRDTARVEAPRDRLEVLVTVVGDHAGGPRDLLDLHVTALDRVLVRKDDPHTRSVVFEARLLVLEMMGLLVDYYRVGHRRRFNQGTAP